MLVNYQEDGKVLPCAIFSLRLIKAKIEFEVLFSTTMITIINYKRIINLLLPK